VFSFGARHGFVTTNPVENASVRKTDNRRGRFLTLDEVSLLGEAFNQVEAAGANPKAVAIARLWALTGCRRNDMAGLKVHEVKLDRRVQLAPIAAELRIYPIFRYNKNFATAGSYGATTQRMPGALGLEGVKALGGYSRLGRLEG
jgi:site-specific recombinase XerD